MIQALLFDFGGVLMRTEDLAPRRKWEARLGLRDWQLHDIVFGSPTAQAATVGQATEAEVWEAIGKRFGLLPAELAELQKDFWAGDRLDEALLDWIITQHGRCRTGILSNYWTGARQFFTGLPKVAAAFETLVISAEEGIRKPQPEIFTRALQRLNVAAGETVFVDDALENIVAARQLGLVAIQFKPGLNLPEELRRIEMG